VTGRRHFDPSDELGPAGADELADARAAAAWLDEAVDRAPVTPSADFGDRVMAALAGEPVPATGGFLAPVRRRGLLAGFGASVRQAWRSLGGGRPVSARATALAYVLVVAVAGTSLVGVTTIGLAGALGVIGPSATHSASPPPPGPTVAPATILPSESPPPAATESPSPSEPAEGSDDHGGGSGSEPSDDHGDGSGPGGDDDEHSAEPTRTPRPSETPEPSESDD
jgi:hypothetical protein